MTTPLSIAVIRRDLSTAQHLILLGAPVALADIPIVCADVYWKLMFWAITHLVQRDIFIYTVLTAIHDDGSHVATGKINALARLSGLRELRIKVAEYIGIKNKEEHTALKSAMAVWTTMPNMAEYCTDTTPVPSILL